MSSADPWRNLAAAIVLRAVIDLITANDFLKRHSEAWAREDIRRFRKYLEYKALQSEAENFMRSQWFHLLCDYDGEEIITHIRKGEFKKGAIQSAERSF